MRRDFRLQTKALDYVSSVSLSQCPLFRPLPLRLPRELLVVGPCSHIEFTGAHNV